jgi:cellulose synthase/poly-beta-1,6-N-acetylglucosamine synthase-like glycosyltransferase
MIAEIIFISSLMLIAYTYTGYPVLIFALSRMFGRPVMQASITPKVSLIIAAYNEERDIAAKIENSLALDYPKEKFEIIVASDCSRDRTDEIVRQYTNRNVILHRQPERLGKSVAQNSAMKISTGEILVFSDATTMYEPDVLRKIARNFADPEVGCVAGNLVYVDRISTAVGKGCRSYWGYEKFLKQCESTVGSLIGVSGCLYAVRRSNYARIAHDMSSDFVIATEIHLQGRRTIYEEEAVSLEETNERSRDEFRMRVRVIEQTMSAMDRYREVLNPLRHGMYAFQMISHKLLRYAVPLFLITAFISNLFLVNESTIYHLSFWCQAALYLTALAGLLGERMNLKLGPLAIPYYFVLANAASLVAFLKYVRGEAHIVWEPLRDAGPQVEQANSEVAGDGISQ